MKTAHQTFRVIIFAFGTAAISTFSSCHTESTSVPAQGKDGAVTFEPHGIVMHPGTKLSKSDEVMLNEILKKYDDRLYRLETYQNGKLIKTQGRLKEKELTDVYITQELVSELANAKAAGLSVFTWVFDTSDKMAPLHQLGNEKALIQQLKPVLQKYTKQ
jgi:hypothetical protein